MPSEKDIAWIASLVGDPARSRILLALMDGRARTAKELAFFARIAAPTASGHLAKLLDAHLVAVEPQGRRRYYRLASERVGQMIESMAIVAGDALPFLRPGRRIPEPLATARRCYDHLAGRTGVAIVDALLRRGFVVFADGGGEVTAEGHAFFAGLGLDLARFGATRRVFGRPASTGPSGATTSRARSERPCASIAWSALGSCRCATRAPSRSRGGAGGSGEPFRDRRGSARARGRAGGGLRAWPRTPSVVPGRRRLVRRRGRGPSTMSMAKPLLWIHKASLRDRLLRWIPFPSAAARLRPGMTPRSRPGSEDAARSLPRNHLDVRSSRSRLELAGVDLPSWRAISRYSPSASVTEGKAPIASRIVSPPGVSTLKATPAKASPPATATSLRVTVAARWLSTASVTRPSRP
jgi:DNA-binding transcriptional ArsR family regulator